ncbi:UDP-4-amino-4-deoxy-L-arabinose--oxoglutarate aminotransferase [subsurface metagenome]
MIEKLETWDIVMARYSSSDERRDEKDLGLVYDIKGDELQILYMSSEKNPDHLHQVKISNEDLIDGNLPQDYFVITDRVLLMKKGSVVEKVGRISVQKIDELLRQMAHNIVEKHYDAVHRKDKDFSPGKTYIRYAGRVYDMEEMKALVDSSLDFWLTAGRFAKQFEEEFAKFLGLKHCILTNSGSSANLLAISALTSPNLGKRRLKPGDEIITTACAFPTSVNPIIQNNLIPVFLDVDVGAYNIQVDKIEDALSEKTKAIFLAHTLGNPFNLDTILKICEKYNLWLIEDNCDALGSKYNGKYTGTFGHIATFSFYPAHHITMGEGGALVTNDPLLKQIIVSFRDWGKDCWCEPGHDNTCGKRFGWQSGSLPYGYDHKYIFSHIGYNLKVTDMQAAVGVAQLKKLPQFIKARKKNWGLFYDELKKYNDYFILPKAADNSDPSWFGFLLTVKENAPFSRNEITNYLEKNKIATRLLFSGNIIRHPSFENLKYRIYGNLKNTDFIMNNTFWLGVYPGLTNQIIEYVKNKFEIFLNSQL